MNNDTIVAVATAAGIGSIAIVRISGPQALAIAVRMTRREALLPRYATLASLYDRDGAMIDQAIVIYYRGPASFTGEDIVEFQCHGGSAAAALVTATAVACGGRIALPGEYTKRAFLSGKIDAAQAEAIAAMINARSGEAARLLARQIKGELGEFVAKVRDDLVRMVAYSEVLIDYSEEDLPGDVMDQLAAQLEAMRQLLERTVRSSLRREGMMNGYKVAVIGKPNVGKSSLLNALLSYNRAIVSEIAGTTRDTIEESVRIGSHLVTMVDTAGIREASDMIEKIGIERSLAAAEEARIVVAMFDRSRPWDDDDDRIAEVLSRYEKDKEILVIINKTDLPDRCDRSKVSRYDPLFLSSKEEIAPLIDRLESLLNGMSGEDETLLVSMRQIEAARSCAAAVGEAIAPLRRGELELFSFHVNEAIAAISSITRPYDVEEMLGVMFGSFCLGK